MVQSKVFVYSDERGFNHADYYLHWENDYCNSGISPDNFFTSPIGESLEETAMTAKRHWPDANIQILEDEEDNDEMGF